VKLAAKPTQPEKTVSPSRQLAGFLAKFKPEIRSLGKEALSKLRKRLPTATEFVYDNYYALVIGFGPNERPSDAIFSLVLYPNHVSLCFLQGAQLPDKQKLLLGNGNVVRHIRLADASVLDKPAVRALMADAIDWSKIPFPVKGRRRMFIRLISAKQRPRR